MASKKPMKDHIHAKGTDIAVVSSGDENDYISLTDIARYKSDAPDDVIKNWMRNRDTIEFLGLWEQLNNPEFKPVEFDGFRIQAGSNTFTMSPKKWVDATSAIGIFSKAGRYGGTFAHRDIAFEFASWISAEFKLYIIKDYQRLHGEDVITTPKTKKSNRTIKMPNFLCDEMRDYLGMLYGVKKKDRIFTVTKSYLHHEMDRGAKEAGVKRIRIHDLRHSHISLLIDMGFSAVAIADRVGHESIEITYRYAHLFPSKQTEMADKLDFERTGA